MIGNKSSCNITKYYKLFILRTSGMSGHFHQKQYNQIVEALILICMQKYEI